MSKISLFRCPPTPSPVARLPGPSSSCSAALTSATRGQDEAADAPVALGAALEPAAAWRWRVLLLLGLVCFTRPAPAQFPPGTELSTRSYSGQFVVAGHPQPSALPPALATAPQTNLVRLEPRLVALSCERIKEALLRTLGAPDRWRGKVFLRLHPIRTLHDPILITSERFTDGWMYRVDMPDGVETTRFVEALVRVLLTEWANRNNAGRTADIPVWLAEGLPEELRWDTRLELLMRPPVARDRGPPMRVLNQQGRWSNPLATAHAFFLAHPPLTLAELSWPKPDQFVGDAALTYRYSAQLFVHELLRLRNGQAALCALLDRLAQHLNWQTAFFQAFGAYFQRPLDLEKWWDLQVVDFSSHELSQAWNRQNSVRKLDEILNVFVQVRASSNAPVTHADVPLQDVILEGDDVSQGDLWSFKIQQLQALRIGVVPEVMLLADEYRRTLETYLRRMHRSRSVPGGVPNHYEQIRTARETVKQLNLLDQKRIRLRAAAATAPPGASKAAKPAKPQKP